MFVLDSHCDTPSEILRGRDLSIDNHNAHVDFPKLVKGGVDGAFFALYIPASFDSDPESGFDHAERMLEGVERSVSENSDIAAFASNRIQALKNREEGKFSVFLALENGSPIGDSIDNIKWFYNKGIRYITLCHSSDNQICDSCASAEKTWGGLSPFGKEVVAEMNRLG